MLSSLRLVASSVRGLTALTSGQLGSQLGTQSCMPPSVYLTQGGMSKTYCPSGSMDSRPLTTNSAYSQAARTNKMDPVISEAALDLPTKPKKPITPWIMFLRERKDQIIARHGTKMSAAEISVILAKEWRDMDKTNYEREYQLLRDDYIKQVEEYEKSLTDEHLYLIEYQKEAKRESKAKKQLKKTNPPVLPRNSANLYCQERSKQDDIKERLKTHKPTEVYREIFKDYRSLSESEKKKYLNMQEADKLRFQHEFLAWFEGVQNNENLTKAAREQANAMRERLKTLSYI